MKFKPDAHGLFPRETSSGVVFFPIRQHTSRSNMTKAEVNAAMQNRFVTAVQGHSGILHRICQAYGRNREEREDLQQEILLQLWRSFAHFRGDASFSTWMYRVALNTALMGIRRRARMIMAVPLEEDPPAREIDRPMSDEVHLLMEEVRRLPPLDRALVILNLEGKSHAEIADIHGLSAGAVNVRLVRARDRLKKGLMTRGYQGGSHE